MSTPLGELDRRGIAKQEGSPSAFDLFTKAGERLITAGMPNDFPYSSVLYSCNTWSDGYPPGKAASTKDIDVLVMGPQDILNSNSSVSVFNYEMATINIGISNLVCGFNLDTERIKLPILTQPTSPNQPFVVDAILRSIHPNFHSADELLKLGVLENGNRGVLLIGVSQKPNGPEGIVTWMELPPDYKETNFMASKAIDQNGNPVEKFVPKPPATVTPYIPTPGDDRDEDEKDRYLQPPFKTEPTQAVVIPTGTPIKPVDKSPAVETPFTPQEQVLKMVNYDLETRFIRKPVQISPEEAEERIAHIKIDPNSIDPNLCPELKNVLNRLCIFNPHASLPEINVTVRGSYEHMELQVYVDRKPTILKLDYLGKDSLDFNHYYFSISNENGSLSSGTIDLSNRIPLLRMSDGPSPLLLEEGFYQDLENFSDAFDERGRLKPITPPLPSPYTQTQKGSFVLATGKIGFERPERPATSAFGTPTPRMAHSDERRYGTTIRTQAQAADVRKEPETPPTELWPVITSALQETGIPYNDTDLNTLKYQVVDVYAQGVHHQFPVFIVQTSQDLFRGTPYVRADFGPDTKNPGTDHIYLNVGDPKGFRPFLFLRSASVENDLVRSIEGDDFSTRTRSRRDGFLGHLDTRPPDPSTHIFTTPVEVGIVFGKINMRALIIGIHRDEQSQEVSIGVTSRLLPTTSSWITSFDNSGQYIPAIQPEKPDEDSLVDQDQTPQAGVIFPADRLHQETTLVTKPTPLPETPLERKLRLEREEAQRSQTLIQQKERERRRNLIQPTLDNLESIIDTERNEKRKLIGKQYGLEGLRFSQWEKNPTETDLISCVSEHGEARLKIVTTPTQKGVKIELSVNGAVKRVFQVNKGEQPSPEAETIVYLLTTNPGIVTTTQNNRRQRPSGDPKTYAPRQFSSVRPTTPAPSKPQSAKPEKTIVSYEKGDYRNRMKVEVTAPPLTETTTEKKKSKPQTPNQYKVQGKHKKKKR